MNVKSNKNGMQYIQLRFQDSKIFKLSYKQNPASFAAAVMLAYQSAMEDSETASVDTSSLDDFGQLVFETITEQFSEQTEYHIATRKAMSDGGKAGRQNTADKKMLEELKNDQDEESKRKVRILETLRDVQEILHVTLLNEYRQQFVNAYEKGVQPELLIATAKRIAEDVANGKEILNKAKFYLTCVDDYVKNEIHTIQDDTLHREQIFKNGKKEPEKKLPLGFKFY